MTPNGSSPANGAICYSYDAEDRLNKVETHDGSGYAEIAEAAYNGEGNRARLVTWAASVPLDAASHVPVGKGEEHGGPQRRCCPMKHLTNWGSTLIHFGWVTEVMSEHRHAPVSQAC